MVSNSAPNGRAVDVDRTSVEDRPSSSRIVCDFGQFTSVNAEQLSRNSLARIGLGRLPMSAPAAKIAPTENTPAFMGVERSLTGRRWRTRSAELGAVEAFRRKFALPEIAA